MVRREEGEEEGEEEWGSCWLAGDGGMDVGGDGDGRGRGEVSDRGEVFGGRTRRRCVEFHSTPLVADSVRLNRKYISHLHHACPKMQIVKCFEKSKELPH